MGELQLQQPGSLHRLSTNARGEIIGKALATDIPEATKEEEQHPEWSGRRSQVPQTSLLSSHYPVNTDMQVVSDQLGRHKDRSWSSAGGSEMLHLGHCLFLSLCCFFVFIKSGWSGWPGKRRRGGWREGRGNFILHLAKDVKQSPRHTVQGHRWTSGLCTSSVCTKHNALKHFCRLGYKECPVLEKGRAWIICDNN